MTKMVKIEFLPILCLIPDLQSLFLSSLPLEFNLWDRGFSVYWTWILSPSISVIYHAENGQNSEKIVKMLIQGQCGPWSRDFSIFFTPETDSLGQKTWYMMLGIHSSKYKFKNNQRQIQNKPLLCCHHWEAYFMLDSRPTITIFIIFTTWIQSVRQIV